jgi:3D (Asp-Asp-Asp) domain-containing protein
MTAYTSRPEETDDSPFITADGSHVRDGIVAANFLPFGTKVRIPKLFGDKVFEVHDRMNKRYPYKMDFWMEELNDARQFGVRRADIEIVQVEEVPTNANVEIAFAK